MVYIYISPLRPPGVDWITRRNGLEMDWDNTEIGPWHPKQKFAVNGPIPQEMVDQMTLELVETK